MSTSYSYGPNKLSNIGTNSQLDQFKTVDGQEEKTSLVVVFYMAPTQHQFQPFTQHLNSPDPVVHSKHIIVTRAITHGKKTLRAFSLI